MTHATLQRLETSDQGTFGRLTVGSLNLFTGELPWRDNQASRSCVLPGVYLAVVTYSPRFKRGLYLLAPTAPRSGIRIHPANLMGDPLLGWRSQLNGCIALGEKLGWIDGQKALLLSQPAHRRLEQLTGGRPFKLEIRS